MGREAGPGSSRLSGVSAITVTVARGKRAREIAGGTDGLWTLPGGRRIRTVGSAKAVIAGDEPQEIGFALDSSPERAGFEPSVPNDTPCALSRALQNRRQAIPQFNAAGMYQLSS
jgi:hypothetical protein